MFPGTVRRRAIIPEIFFEKGAWPGSREPYLFGR